MNPEQTPPPPAEKSNNWRGMTQSSFFQLPAFPLLIIVLLAVIVTFLVQGKIFEAP